MERRKPTISSNLILGNALLDMYVKCQKVELALRTFGALKEKDIVSWNMIVAGCAKVGELEQARLFFYQMPCRDIVSWNSLVTGYACRGDFASVKELIVDMVMEKVIPDTVTMISLVSAATESGALDQGRWAHGWVIRMQIKLDAFLGSALIDMYCKCGSIERASRVFKEINKKDVTVWTTMITGLAFHGYGSKALELFSEMQEDVSPDDVTFVSVLSACSHSGLVDQGIKVFSSMTDYGIEPGVEHYGCLVDLLARSGRLSEAKDIIDQMPMKPSRSIWGAMLNACQAQGDVELAEIASRELLNLDPEEEGGYTLLSNIYAASGRWSYSKKIRETMESRGVKKTAGCSSLVVDGVVHNFISADKCHPGWVDISSILNCLKNEMKPGADLGL
jgi:pentatricopeptide repeat protein